MTAPRPATAADHAAMAAIHAEAFEPEARWDEAAIAELLAVPGSWALVAGEPADGFIMMRDAGGDAEVLTVAVRPAARRGGLGGELVEAALVRAVALGAEVVFLEVAEDNEPARALYKGFGFVQVGRRPGYYRRSGGARMDALVLQWRPPAAP